MNIVENEDGPDSVSRVEFCRDLVEDLREGLEESFILPLVIQSVSNNLVTYSANNGESVESETVNIGDEDLLELMFVTYVVIGSSTLTLPKVIIHFSEEDFETSGEYVVDGLELHDFAGQIVTTGSTVGTLKVELSATYLRNLLRMKGIISTSNSEAKPKSLEVIKSESIEGIHEFDEIFKEMFEGDAYSLAGLKQRQRTKSKRLRAIDLKRRANPALTRKRSIAAKLRWRRNRSTILRGMRKFHRSAQGKRLHKMLGKLNED